MGNVYCNWEYPYSAYQEHQSAQTRGTKGQWKNQCTICLRPSGFIDHFEGELDICFTNGDSASRNLSLSNTDADGTQKGQKANDFSSLHRNNKKWKDSCISPYKDIHIVHATGDHYTICVMNSNQQWGDDMGGSKWILMIYKRFLNCLIIIYNQ